MHVVSDAHDSLLFMYIIYVTDTNTMNISLLVKLIKL